MKASDLNPQTLLIGAALVGVAWYVWRKGGIVQAATAAGTAAGAAVVNTAGAVASGAVGAVGASVGLPTPDETTTDPKVARWIIDREGYFEASKWAGAPALARAMFMDAGTGTPPPANSAAGRRFLGAAAPVASYDETDRLLARYPAPATTAPDMPGGFWQDFNYGP